ncbi:PAS domain S-box protein [Phnomibacter ginsenosidimutans]|uniref:histidine kinase n=1 Tax=Phnomibacter ginsenosidimutans TaxID=2676868 RepID=A0A6I6GL07_9BACT|nr:PAS domain S-box protein [Phnomibacter ginsenosidimutans]QGW29135.1 PAS domain S-box protein [Phnomibacter ginsenosidimutans]
MNVKPGFTQNTGGKQTSSVMYLQQAVNSIDDGLLVCQEDLTVVYANNSLYRIFDLHPVLVVQQSVAQLLFKISNTDLSASLTQAFDEQSSFSIEFEYRQSGTWYIAEVFPFDKGLTIRLRDVTPYREAHEELLKSRRLYAFISEVNELILRANTEEETYASLCDIAIETGGFMMAWIGMPDQTTGKVEPAFKAGTGTDYLTSIKGIALADVPEGRGPSGTAMRKGIPVFCNDIATDPMMAIFRDEGLKRGFRSSIALPLTVDNKPIALLSLYSALPNFFANEEVTLLVQVSKNISYALQAIISEKKRKAAEGQLYKISRAIEQSSASVVITDVNGSIEYVNPAFCKLTGYTEAEAIGQNPNILKTGYTKEDEYKQLWNDISHLKDWHGEFKNKTKYGEVYWESATISPITNKQGEITHYVAVKENITEKKKLEEEQQALVNLIENTTAYVAIGDLEFNLQYANQATKDVLGLTETDISNHISIDEFIPESMDEASRMAVIEQLQKDGKWSGEYRFKSRRGFEIVVWMVTIMHRHKDGSPSHFSATAVDITKAKETEQQLRQLTNELRELSIHLQDLSEIEKKEIARDIHDEMGQQLTALKFDAKWLKRHMEDMPPEVEERLDALIENVNELSSSFRRIHSSLHPNILEDLGLQGSLEWLVSNFTHKTNISVQFDCYIEPHIFPAEINLIVYRVAQECLTNIVRYAQANKVHIVLLVNDNQVELRISDDGVGFNYQQVDTRLHHGLLGMRERLNAANGHLNIATAPGLGTTVEAKIPLTITTN